MFANSFGIRIVRECSRSHDKFMTKNWRAFQKNKMEFLFENNAPSNHPSYFPTLSKPRSKKRDLFINNKDFEAISRFLKKSAELNDSEIVVPLDLKG